MRVTVVICTWNRSDLLRTTLESLRSLVIPAGYEWELVVVNNASDDTTDDVISAYRELLPLRRLFEPKQGLSIARNTGTRDATGDLILFTDDDVRVEPDWMKAYVEAAEHWPGAGYFGGLVHPHFGEGVPPWVRRNHVDLAGMLSFRDVGPTSRSLRWAEFPYGPNMAVRRQVMSLASFDERVGRRGREQVRGSESSLFWSLQRQGVSGVWVPQAKVYHWVPRCRANLGYVWAYYYGRGRMEVRLANVCELPLQSPLRLRMSALRALASVCVRPRSWPGHLATVASVLGQLSESRRPALLRETAARAGSAGGGVCP